MLFDETREIDVGKDVRVVNDKRPAREERLGVLERAAGAEDRVLGEEDDPVAPGRCRGPRAHELGLPVQVDGDLAVAYPGEPVQDPLDDRHAEDRQERLGQMARDGSEPLAEPCRGKEDIEGVLTHPHELIARRRSKHHETGRVATRRSEGLSTVDGPRWRRRGAATSRWLGRTPGW